MKKEMPPKEIAMDMAKRAKPLIAAIRQEIVNGNKEWRKVLTEEQREQHNRDLDLMKRQFESIEGKIERMSKGDVRPSDFGARVSKRPLGVRRPEDACT